MKEHLIFKTVLKFLLTILLGFLPVACTNSGESGNNSSIGESGKIDSSSVKVKVTSQNNNEIAVTPPPFTEGIFPCNDCHAYQKPNPVRRKLVDMHQEISEMFNHDSKNRWCLDCHDLNNRDSLRLASGALLDFKESYKLCGQCHGDKLRDWKVGVHGKRTGYWNGRKQYYLCVNCHNPHSPKFPPMKPEPPPVREDELYK